MLAFTALVFWSPGLMLTWVFGGVMQMARYPVGLYPGWLRLVLTRVVPVGIITTVPAEALTGRLPPGMLVGSVALALAMRASESRLALDVEAMTRLQALSTRLVQPDALMTLLQEILAAATEITGADKGNIQFADERSGGLRIVVHQGLGERFLQHFAEVGCAACCGLAQTSGQRVIPEDVRQEPARREHPDSPSA